MGYRLQMSAEIRDWLADLRDTDPPAALLAGQALAALAEEGEGLGPPLVCPASPAGARRPAMGAGPALSGPAGIADGPAPPGGRRGDAAEGHRAADRRAAVSAGRSRRSRRSASRAAAAARRRDRGRGTADRHEPAGAGAGRRLPDQEGGPEGGPHRGAGRVPDRGGRGPARRRRRHGAGGAQRADRRGVRPAPGRHRRDRAGTGPPGPGRGPAGPAPGCAR